MSHHQPSFHLVIHPNRAQMSSHHIHKSAIQSCWISIYFNMYTNAIDDSVILHSWPPGSITAKWDIDNEIHDYLYQLTSLMWARILSASADRLSAILQEHFRMTSIISIHASSYLSNRCTFLSINTTASSKVNWTCNPNPTLTKMYSVSGLHRTSISTSRQQRHLPTYMWACT